MTKKPFRTKSFLQMHQERKAAKIISKKITGGKEISNYEAKTIDSIMSDPYMVGKDTAKRWKEGKSKEIAIKQEKAPKISIIQKIDTPKIGTGTLDITPTPGKILPKIITPEEAYGIKIFNETSNRYEPLINRTAMEEAKATGASFIVKQDTEKDIKKQNIEQEIAREFANRPDTRILHTITNEFLGFDAVVNAVTYLIEGKNWNQWNKMRENKRIEFVKEALNAANEGNINKWIATKTAQGSGAIAVMLAGSGALGAALKGATSKGMLAMGGIQGTELIKKRIEGTDKVEDYIRTAAFFVPETLSLTAKAPGLRFAYAKNRKTGEKIWQGLMWKGRKEGPKGSKLLIGTVKTEEGWKLVKGTPITDVYKYGKGGWKPETKAEALIAIKNLDPKDKMAVKQTLKVMEKIWGKESKWIRGWHEKHIKDGTYKKAELAKLEESLKRRESAEKSIDENWFTKKIEEKIRKKEPVNNEEIRLYNEIKKDKIRYELSQMSPSERAATIYNMEAARRESKLGKYEWEGEDRLIFGGRGYEPIETRIEKIKTSPEEYIKTGTVNEESLINAIDHKQAYKKQLEMMSRKGRMEHKMWEERKIRQLEKATENLEGSKKEYMESYLRKKAELEGVELPKKSKLPRGLKNIDERSSMIEQKIEALQKKDDSSYLLKRKFRLESETSSPRQLIEILKFGKKKKGYGYGSFYDRPQVSKQTQEWRKPGDNDLFFNVGEKKATEYTKQLFEKLKKIEENEQKRPIRISPEKKTLIEVKKEGEWHHMIDLHNSEDFGSSGFYGHKYGQKTDKISGHKVMPLSESTPRQMESALMIHDKPQEHLMGGKIGPLEHRMKDIGKGIAYMEEMALSLKNPKEQRIALENIWNYRDEIIKKYGEIPQKGEETRILIPLNKSPSTGGTIGDAYPLWTSPKAEPSRYKSTSPSITLYPSISPSISTDRSKPPAFSISQSPSPSKGYSISPSYSPSHSPSYSPSYSPSPSKSPSYSPSYSPSPSKSPSYSPSTGTGETTIPKSTIRIRMEVKEKGDKKRRKKRKWGRTTIHSIDDPLYRLTGKSKYSDIMNIMLKRRKGGFYA